MEDISQEISKKPGGNTGAPRYQLYRWIITVPMKMTAQELSQDLQGFCKEFYFQGEEGKLTGYKHWQGAISLKDKQYFLAVKNLMPNGTHIEQCRDWYAAKNYCNKSDTRIEGPYDHTTEFIDTLSQAIMFPWQLQLLKLLEEKPDDRTILWLWSKRGHMGKTQIGKYLMVHHKAAYFTGGTPTDIAHCYTGQKIAIFNFSRSKKGKVNYDSMESLKDGIVFSPKYESNTKVFNSPHVVVTCNFAPDTTALSTDRWDIRKIDNKKPLPDRAPRGPSPTSSDYDDDSD